MSTLSARGSGRRSGRPGQRSGSERHRYPVSCGDFQADLKHRLGLLRREIDSLRGGTSRIAEKARGEYVQALDTLLHRADRLERWVESLRESGGDAWQSVQCEAEESWQELKQAVQRTALSFRQRFPLESDGRDQERPRR